MSNRTEILAILGLFVIFSTELVITHADGHSEILFEEDSASVTLGDSIDEGNGQGTKGIAVWSKKGLKGWTVKSDFKLKGNDPLPNGFGIEE